MNSPVNTVMQMLAGDKNIDNGFKAIINTNKGTKGE